MKIGNGDIAQALIDRDDVIFFASGVSDSRCEDIGEYLREELLLVDIYNRYYVRGTQIKSLFYFSSIAINMYDSKYFIHKRSMERMVRELFMDCVILRIGNITWGNNPNTFLNYLRGRKELGLPINVRDEYKYMISKDQFQMITSCLPSIGQHTISVFGEMKKVKDLI
jgi:hypothetical protein